MGDLLNLAEPARPQPPQPPSRATQPPPAPAAPSGGVDLLDLMSEMTSAAPAPPKAPELPIALHYCRVPFKTVLEERVPGQQGRYGLGVQAAFQREKEQIFLDLKFFNGTTERIHVSRPLTDCVGLQVADELELVRAEPVGGAVACAIRVSERLGERAAAGGAEREQERAGAGDAADDPHDGEVHT